MAKSFTDILREQKERFKGEKEQIPLQEAATEFALENNKKVNLEYRENIQSKGGDTEPPRVGPQATKIAKDFISLDLNRIQDADFEEFKNVIIENETLLNELQNSRRFTGIEKEYIKASIEPVLNELAPLATTFRRISFAGRDFVKQFKPIKLADRFFSGIPILGGVIKRKIERQEAGERKLRAAETAVGKEEAEAARKLKGLDVDATVEDQLADTGPVQGASALEETREELADRPSPIISAEPDFRPVSDIAMKRASGEEEREELQAKKDDQFEEQKGLLEMIAEATYESNENLKRLVKEEEGILDDIGGAAASVGGAAVGAGGALATGAVAKKFFGKGPQPSSGAPVKKTSALSKAGKFLKGGARVAGKLFLPVTAAIGLFDAFKGASQADEILGKEQEDLTLRDKASAGVGGLLEGLSFGLIKKDKVAKFLAGKQDENIVSDVMPTSNDAKEALEPNKPMKDVVNIDSKRTNVRTTLETDSIANSLEKLFKDMPQGGNTIVAPNNTLNNSNQTTVLPDLSNKNLDTTANSLKNVY